MINAPSHSSAWDGTNSRHWILFDGVNNLQVTGGGIINGNGQIWWKNSCKINKSLVSLLFYFISLFFKIELHYAGK